MIVVVVGTGRDQVSRQPTRPLVAAEEPRVTHAAQMGLLTNQSTFIIKLRLCKTVVLLHNIIEWLLLNIYSMT